MIEPTTRVVHRPPDPPINLAEAGDGRPVLVLHGGGGPFTVQSLIAHLSESMRVLAPTHPGWNGTERPDWCTGIDDLADAYLHLITDEGLDDVAVVGDVLRVRRNHTNGYVPPGGIGADLRRRLVRLRQRLRLRLKRST